MGNSTVFEHSETLKALNLIGENILIADGDFTIIWLNEAARTLMKTLGKHVGIDNPDDFIGQSLHRFYEPRQQNILANGPFPHEVRITLFKRHSASMYVDVHRAANGEIKGYIVTWKDMTQYEEERRVEQKKREELYTPIIETVSRMYFLIPLTGQMDSRRVEIMTEKVLREVGKRNCQFVIFDFTGITEVEIENLDIQLDKLAKALRLMGAEALYVGFPIEIVQSFVRNGLDITIKSFPSFKEGVQYVWRKYGYELKKRE